MRRYIATSMPRGRETLFAALEAEQGSAYLLGLDLSIQYVNEAWRRFARENGAPDPSCGWDTQQPITTHFQSPHRESFALKFQRGLERNEAWSHTYECSSTEIYRKFNMHVRPGAERDGLIVVHSLLVEIPLLRNGSEFESLAAQYTDTRGLIVQCSFCGRVREPATSSWHWAPGLLGAQCQNVSHGICSTCNFQHYG